MRRRAPHEKVDPYRITRDRQGLTDLRERVSEWSDDVRDTATGYASYGNVDIPVEDRQADVWEPLLVVAQLAGGNWPYAAREACKAMCAKAEAEDADYSPGQQLLNDIRDVFKSDEFMRSSDLVAQLNMLQTSPKEQLKSDMRLNQISPEEADILREIIPLIHKLPQPLTDYTAAIGEIRERELGIPGRRRHRQEAVECRR
jgi:Protein of unknown function (DUF3631)